MNEENIIIMGDDLAEQTINIQPAPARDPNPAADEGSWLSNRKNVFAENFLRQHEPEFQEYERRERDKMACAERFRALEAKLIARRQWLENLRADVAALQAVDLGTDIYLNMKRSGRSLLDITQTSLFAATLVVQRHGKRILQLAEKEVADLQEQFDAFKSHNEEALSELKLL